MPNLSPSERHRMLSRSFEQAVQQIQKDIRLLAQKGKVRQGFIDKQNRILKNLIDYYNDSEQLIQSSRDELVNTQIANNSNRRKTDERIVKMEAICIMHGIVDFPYYLRFGKDTLINWTTDIHKDGLCRIPDMLWEKIKKLPKAKSKMILKSLSKKIDQKIINLHEKLEKHALNTNRETYVGTRGHQTEQGT